MKLAFCGNDKLFSWNFSGKPQNRVACRRGRRIIKGNPHKQMPPVPPNPLAAFRFDGRVVIVTGGASGIGRASADLFAVAGAHVVIMDLHENEAYRAAEKIRAKGGQASAFALDIADADAVARVFDEAITQAGRVDALVCSAGAGANAPAEAMSLEQWSAAITVNLTGSFACAQAVAKRMIPARQGGSIVFVTSVMGLSGGGFGNNVNYQASKGGVVNLARGLAVEWAEFGIRVNAVAPGWVRTPFIRSWSSDPERLATLAQWVPLGRLAEPEEIATAILFLASPAASMITGHTLPVDGGFMAK